MIHRLVLETALVSQADSIAQMGLSVLLLSVDSWKLLPEPTGVLGVCNSIALKQEPLPSSKAQEPWSVAYWVGHWARVKPVVSAEY
jgi:hypothetical protein